MTPQLLDKSSLPSLLHIETQILFSPVLWITRTSLLAWQQFTRGLNYDDLFCLLQCSPPYYYDVFQRCLLESLDLVALVKGALGPLELITIELKVPKLQLKVLLHLSLKWPRLK